MAGEWRSLWNLLLGWRGTELQGFTQIVQLGWLAENEIDVRGNFAFGDQTLPPPGEKNHRGRPGHTLYEARNFTTVYARHAQIRNYNGERFTIRLRSR